MSLLTPERVPVKVYRWDDAGAPQLDKTAGCMAIIFKACLVTGYGTKEGAGWTMPFEDTVAKVKVLKPEVGPHTDFYLRLSADTGTEMAAQVYLNMTGASTGDLKLQCATAFKYAKGTTSGKWLLVASPRGVWFFNEQYANAFGSPTAAKTGTYFYAGDVRSASNNNMAVYLQHTGGGSNNGAYANILKWSGGASADYYVAPKILNDNTVSEGSLYCIVGGASAIANADIVTMPLITANNEAYFLPALYVPVNGAVHKNFDAVNVVGNGSLINCINFGTSANTDGNTYIAIDNWSY